MNVLLDTCVVSEVRRTQGHPRVRERVEAIRSQNLFLSVVTLGEVTKGISLLDDGAQKEALSRWLLMLEQDYAARILPIDVDTSRIWGEITARAQRRGRVVPACDGLIAATAIRHGLHVMTRNTADFQETGAMLINPWEDA
ncbi:MAG: ribonuclease VapC [Gemmatimonadota bacterium]|nr:MAG: ribonuclease VapC [Gemmatimonadota bacterium]